MNRPQQLPIRISDPVPAILAAAEIVLDRLGPDQLTMTEIARVAFLPVARISRHFPSTDAIVAALSVRELSRLGGAIEAAAGWPPRLDESRGLERIIEAFAGLLDDPAVAHLVLRAPTDSVTEQARQGAVHRLGELLGRGLPAGGDPDAAAELVFDCFRRCYIENGAVGSSAVAAAHRALRSSAAAAAA